MKTFDLLQTAVALKEGVEQITVEQLRSKLNKELKGKEVNAFTKRYVAPTTDRKGNDVKGTQTFNIRSVDAVYVDFDYSDKDTFISLDVHLKGYNTEAHDLIYTDTVFLRAIKDLIKKTSVGVAIKSIDYSEHGMQGDSHVNLDVVVRVKKPEGISRTYG